jgi:yhgE/pip C-terminal domain
MFLVQRFALGLHAINELGLWASMCLIAVTFITITQGLNNIFGVTVGRVLCLALMTLQIVSSGGLYPPETQPAPLRWFHTIDPMTYSVNLLRRMIFGTEALYDHRAPQALLALIIIFTLFLTASILSAYRDRRWQMKDFRPEVSL